MTIRPGEEWGTEVPRPSAAIVADTDADIVSLPAGVDVVVGGGDLHRSVGAPTRRDPVRRVEVDGLVVRLDDGDEMYGVAHVVIRRSWWRGAVVAVMNVDHLGRWYVAPRAHPNDGRFDVVTAEPTLGIRDRLAARRRLPNGSHVPHPAITSTRDTQRTLAFDRPHRVWVDGRLVGRARRVDVAIVPDRYVVHF